MTERTLFINRLLDGMSTEEQLGQLTQITGTIETRKQPDPSTDATDGPVQVKLEPYYADETRKGQVGSFINIVGTQSARTLQKVAVEESPHHIPLLFALDVVRGHRTIFPCALGEAGSFDPDLAYRLARAAAEEADSQGIHWTFGPDADVARDARWGRINETSGEDPFLVGEMVKAKIHGYQGRNLGSNGAIAATIKHYVGYGAVQAGREYNTVNISPTDLYNTHLPPFIEGVAAGARALMPAYTDFDSVPMHINKPLLNDLLRGRMGFGGVVVSDWSGIHECVLHGAAKNDIDAAKKALKASVDVDMMSQAYRGLAKADLNQEDKKRIRSAAFRVLELKWDLGLFKDPYRNLNPDREGKSLLTAETRKLAREAVAKSVVLLKNNKILPLSKATGKKGLSIALSGVLADAPFELLGVWHGVGKAVDVVTLRKSFAEKAYAKQLLYAKGSHIVEDPDYIKSIELHGVKVSNDLRSNKSMIAEAVAQAKKADVSIAVVGELAMMSGESSSRANPNITEPQMQLLRALRKVAKKLVVIVIAGRPLVIPEVASLADALLWSFTPGTEAGNGIRDIVFGDINPSAKLSVSMPRAVGQLPLFYNQRPTGRPFISTETGDRSTYQDVANSALFPFGFGLSYTTFVYGDPKIDKSEMTGDEKDSVVVSTVIKNKGSLEGEEIVQMYVHQESRSLSLPSIQLRGFQKIKLKPNEEKNVEFKVSLDEVAFFNSQLEKVSEPGNLTVYVGPNSRDLKGVTFQLKDVK